MTIEQAINDLTDVSRSIAEVAESEEDENNRINAQNFADDCKQLAAWLSILKKAKFEYDEAWRIITHPTPDVTYADRDRAQTMLGAFRDSLGRIDDANNNLHV